MNQMRTRHSLRYVYVYYEGEGSEKAYLGGDNARIEQLATDLPSAAIAKQLVQECIADLATYLDGWAIWMGDTEQDAEDRKQMLVQKITELSDALEKFTHRTPALS